MCLLTPSWKCKCMWSLFFFPLKMVDHPWIGYLEFSCLNSCFRVIKLAQIVKALIPTMWDWLIQILFWPILPSFLAILLSLWCLKFESNHPSLLLNYWVFVAANQSYDFCSSFIWCHLHVVMNVCMACPIFPLIATHLSEHPHLAEPTFSLDCFT